MGIRTRHLTLLNRLTAVSLILVAAAVATVAVAQSHRKPKIALKPLPAQRPFKKTETRPSPPSPDADHTLPSLAEQLHTMLNDPDHTYPIIAERVGGKVQPRTPQEEALFQEAVTAMKRVRPVSKERLQFFSWVDQPNIPLIRIGWEAVITQVKPTDQGNLVTMQVRPRVLQGKVVETGRIASVSNLIAEEYLLAQGQVRFVRAYPLTPPEPAFWW